MSRKSQRKSEVFRFYLLISVVMLFVVGMAWLSYLINQTQLSTDTKASGFYRNYFSPRRVGTTIAPTPIKYLTPTPRQDTSRGLRQRSAPLMVTCLQADKITSGQWDISWESSKPSGDYAISILAFGLGPTDVERAIELIRFIPRDKAVRALGLEHVTSYRSAGSLSGATVFAAVQVTEPEEFGEQPTVQRLRSEDVLRRLQNCQLYRYD